MYKNFDPDKPYFYSVALALIIVGIIITTLGAVEWVFNFWAGFGFNAPMFKTIGGLVVLSLGYIHLELELLRIQWGKRQS